MLDIELGRNVVLLRPAGISPASILALADGDEDEETASYLVMIDEIVTRTREHLLEAAEDLRLAVNLYDYDIPVEEGVPSYAARKWIGSVNMIGAFNPTNTQLAYIIACMRANPVLSVLVGCTDAEYLENRRHILETQTAELLGPVRTRKPRIFPARMSWADDDEALPVMRQALAYPYEAA